MRLRTSNGRKSCVEGESHSSSFLRSMSSFYVAAVFKTKKDNRSAFRKISHTKFCFIQPKIWNLCPNLSFVVLVWKVRHTKAAPFCSCICRPGLKTPQIHVCTNVGALRHQITFFCMNHSSSSAYARLWGHVYILYIKCFFLSLLYSSLLTK